MSSNGFELRRMETLNWGNFDGWQKVNFLNGRLENPESSRNSLIAGINGSGKSTMIDGIMVVLLPYANSLHLGVTHDSEAGSGGGRSISDYVLGKYSATGEEELQEGKNAFNREKGLSVILLVFQHRGDPSRVITLARVWWYANYKLKEDAASIIAHGDMSIGDTEGVLNLLNDEERPFSSFRELKKGLTARSSAVQVYDKIGAYFQSLSNHLGGVKKDDLKLLNKAFYMKSVSRIDSFIRNFMLVQNPTESIEELIAHVQHAAEISGNIKKSEDKLSKMKLIISNLQTYFQQHQLIFKLEIEDRLSRIFEKWNANKDRASALDKLREHLNALVAREPDLKEQQDRLHNDWKQTQALLAQNETKLVMDTMSRELEEKEKLAELFSQQSGEISKFCDSYELVAPSEPVEFDEFKKSCDALISNREKQIDSLDTRKAEFRLKNAELEKTSNDLREELKFLEKHQTLIPRGTYSIKTSCIQDLGLPADSLVFVGELISIKKGGDKFRKAVEAVLNPISRNLLCLPEALEDVTQWFNSSNLNRTVTIKRIQSQEMNGTLRRNYGQDSILEKIELKPELENPFHFYLWNWLIQRFYHPIVSPEDFRLGRDHAVTLEGLVKTDRRTMRKLRQDFDFSLGWDTGARVAELSARLANLHDERNQCLHEIKVLDQDKKRLDSEINDIRNAQRMEKAYLNLPDIQARILELQEKLKDLKSNDIDFNRLQEQERELGDKWTVSQKEVLQNETEQQTTRGQITFLETEISKDAEAINTHIEKPYFQSEKLSLVDLLEGVENIETRLEDIKSILESENKSLTDHQDALSLQKKDLEYRKKSNPVRRFLSDYNEAFNEPDLIYEIQNDDRVNDMITVWTEARQDLENTGLPQARKKWEEFYNNTLVESVKTSINEIKSEQKKIKNNIQAINSILRETDFEKLPEESRYLRIEIDPSKDDRILDFKRELKDVEKVISDRIRSLEAGESSKQVMDSLEPFIARLQDDKNYKEHVLDIRNHHRFKVTSLRRAKNEADSDTPVETFTGASKDAKSSAQTTHLAYILLASSLSYRFHFHDPVRGKDSLRLIILDEFGGKFDNEKPKDIANLLQDMGFQSILVSPMTKADLLAEYINQLILIHKVSASESIAKSYTISSREDYDRIVNKDKQPQGIGV